MTTLLPVPRSPNAVSSQADPSDRQHYIAPIVTHDGLNRAIAWLIEHERGTVLSRTDNAAHLVVVTRIMRYKDDVHLIWDGSVLHIRSASRLGWGDLGANRKRVEALRKALVKR